MVYAKSRRCCSLGSCTERPTVNFRGSKTAVYCKQHSQEALGGALMKHCAHGTCSTMPSFNVEGSLRGAYCRRHAGDGMVEINGKRCLHNSCTKRPSWGVLADGVAVSCDRQYDLISGDPVVNFRIKCKSAGCAKISQWGLAERAPTHCPEYGPLNDGLVCTVGTARGKSSCPRPTYRAVRYQSLHVKAECEF